MKYESRDYLGTYKIIIHGPKEVVVQSDYSETDTKNFAGFAHHLYKKIQADLENNLHKFGQYYISVYDYTDGIISKYNTQKLGQYYISDSDYTDGIRSKLPYNTSKITSQHKKVQICNRPKNSPCDFKCSKCKLSTEVEFEVFFNMKFHSAQTYIPVPRIFNSNFQGNHIFNLRAIPD